MWVELLRSNRTDQLNPHLRSIFLSRDQPNPYNPPTKHGSMWVEPVPTHFDPPTKHTVAEWFIFQDRATSSHSSRRRSGFLHEPANLPRKFIDCDASGSAAIYLRPATVRITKPARTCEVSRTLSPVPPPSNNSTRRRPPPSTSAAAVHVFPSPRPFMAMALPQVGLLDGSSEGPSSAMSPNSILETKQFCCVAPFLSERSLRRTPRERGRRARAGWRWPR
jgi:hypothetical protein